MTAARVPVVGAILAVDVRRRRPLLLCALERALEFASCARASMPIHPAQDRRGGRGDERSASHCAPPSTATRCTLTVRPDEIAHHPAAANVEVVSIEFEIRDERSGARAPR